MFLGVGRPEVYQFPQTPLIERGARARYGAQRGMGLWGWKGEGGWPGLEIGRKMNRAKGRGWKQCPEGVHRGDGTEHQPAEWTGGDRRAERATVKSQAWIPIDPKWRKIFVFAVAQRFSGRWISRSERYGYKEIRCTTRMYVRMPSDSLTHREVASVILPRFMRPAR